MLFIIVTMQVSHLVYNTSMPALLVPVVRPSLTMVKIDHICEYIFTCALLDSQYTPEQTYIELNTTINPSLPFGYGGQQCKVLVKLAAGLWKQVVPWGIRGMLGTPFYLPPGVVLHRGKQAHTNKVCVFLLTLTVE